MSVCVYVCERGARVRVHVYVCLRIEMYVDNNNLRKGAFFVPPPPPTSQQQQQFSSSQPLKEEKEGRAERER